MKIPIFALAAVLGIQSFGTAPASADSFASENNRGNKLVADGKPDEAIDAYRAARIERPNDPGVDYNIGNAFHENGAFDTAASAYQQALGHAGGPLLANTEYNLGNTLYRKQDFQAAVEAYKQSLIANPNDRDAKHNLELALKQMQKQDSSQQKPDSSQQDQKKDQNKSDSSQQNQDKNKQDSTDQQKQQDKQNDQQDQQSQNDQQQPPDQQQKQQPWPQQGMSKQDAQRLLDALQNDERKLQQKRAQRMAAIKVEKDW